MESSNIHLNIPKNDLPFLRKMAKRMGWKIVPAKKNGVDLGLEDIKEGRVYHADNAEDMITQIFD